MLYLDRDIINEEERKLDLDCTALFNIIQNLVTALHDYIQNLLTTLQHYILYVAHRLQIFVCKFLA